MKVVTDDSTLRALQQALGRASTGASVIAANLANVDTPGYRAVRARFPAELERAGGLRQQRTDATHLSIGAGPGSMTHTLVDSPGSSTRLDGNTVDLDKEMTALAMLQGRFGAATQMVRRRFAILRYAVTDGRS